LSRSTLSVAVVLVVGLGFVLTPFWPDPLRGERFASWVPLPAEDAFILYRYSQHLAEGHGIVWNVGEPPVDGSTDFLWMLVLAGWDRLTGSLFPGIYFLGALGGLGLILSARVLLRSLGVPTRPLILFGALLVVSPLFVHIVNGFGVPLYAFLLAVATSQLIWLVLREQSPGWRRSGAFGISLLLVGLARPEGNIYNALLLLAVAVVFIRRRDSRSLRTIATAVALTYGVLGFAYLVFRQLYFGEILPAPVFVKVGDGGGTLRIAVDNLRATWLHALATSLTLAIPALLGRKERWGRILLGLHGIVLVFSVVYLGFRQSQNVAMRFQFPTFSLSLLLATCAIAFLSQNTAMRRHTSLAVALVVVAWAILWVSADNLTPQTADDRFAAGQILAKYPDSGYTLATTEAGLLPIVSRWKTLDLYGLNDPEVGRLGVSVGHWNRYKPAVVLAHVDTADVSCDSLRDNWSSDYFRVIRETADYSIVAIVKKRLYFNRSTGSFHIYLLRNDLPEFEEISSALSSIAGEQYISVSPELAAYLSGAVPKIECG